MPHFNFKEIFINIGKNSLYLCFKSEKIAFEIHLRKILFNMLKCYTLRKEIGHVEQENVHFEIRP
jgi:hypothetical protein